MDNAPNNQSQEEQTKRAADSLLKKPETETVKARPSDVAATAAGRGTGLGQAGSEADFDQSHRKFHQIYG